MDIAELKRLAEGIRAQVSKVVIGQADTIELMLVSLFSSGHILLEGPPGTAKTLLAQSFTASLGLKFGRIQFTPDLLPGDILGTNQFNFQTSSFVVNRGPIFCDVLLADEINRTPPKTQAALLEAMQERRVTLDGKSNPLGDTFMVIATENPIEQQGTYPLPEAQLDRFLFKHTLSYPSEAEERALVEAQGTTVRMPDPVAMGVSAIADATHLAEGMKLVGTVRLSAPVVAYIVAIIRATRTSPDLAFGASPRSGAMLAAAARAHAALDGRDYVIPDDVKGLTLPALRHRVVLSASAEIDGRKADDIVRATLESIEAPR
ncbi:MAG TPA: MoxR family ATPase [Rhizomicrobium sp.]|nr:MoxR family ATPase [Rhizomicrobium sp.]